MAAEKKECSEVDAIVIDPDTICGFSCFRPKWLQKFATPRMYLFFFSLSCLFLAIYYNYVIGMISTLEKRYAFPTKISGSLVLSEEIVPIFFNIGIGYIGAKTHRPRLVSFGVLLTAFCCFITALPYFIYGPPNRDVVYTGTTNVSTVEVCAKNSTNSASCDVYTQPSTLPVIGIIMFANFLKGLSNITNNTVAVSYLDDNSKKKNMPIYLALSFSLRLLGPLFGYLLSSATLKYYENPFVDPGFGPEDPRWIGAWWIGFLIQGVLLVIVAVPIALFPRRLPGYSLPGEPIAKQTPNAELQNKNKETGLKDSIFGMFSAMKRLMKNPVFLLMLFNASMKIFGHFGHAVMLPKYFENQFKMSASDANLYSGATGIATIMISTILGGFLIWKYKPSIKVTIILLIATEFFLSAGMIILMIPRCELMDMMNFGTGSNGLILNGECNNNCDCTTSSFTPYCGSDGKTFFSPCFAGCSQEIWSNIQGKTQMVYSNCSCVIGEITEGYCPDETCWNKAVLYISIYLIIVVVGSLLGVVEYVFVMRCVDPKDKSVALGAFETSSSIFGFMPFPVIYGALVDSACLVWGENCGKSGNCWFYDMDLYNYFLHGVSSIFTFLCGLSMICIYFYRNRMGNLYEEEEPEKHNTDLKLEDFASS